MILDMLESSEPHPDIPPDQRIFEPLIGHWDLKVSWHVDGRVVREEDGEWSFARILEGRGVQDVWIVPPRRQRTDGDLYEYGTSVRYYAPELNAWRSTWFGPMHDVVRTFVARGEADGIVLQSDDAGDGALRWVFGGIRRNSFEWRNLVRRGDEWLLQQSFVCSRRR